MLRGCSCLVFAPSWVSHPAGCLLHNNNWLLAPSPQCLSSKVPLQAQKCSSHPAMWHQQGAESTFLGAAVNVWLPLRRELGFLTT